jgi:hypothetical protein
MARTHGMAKAMDMMNAVAKSQRTMWGWLAKAAAKAAAKVKDVMAKVKAKANEPPSYKYAETKWVLSWCDKGHLEHKWDCDVAS